MNSATVHNFTLAVNKKDVFKEEHLFIVSLFLTFLQMTTTGLDFPGGTSDEEATCQCRRHKRHWFNPEEGMATHSNILAWRIPHTEGAGRL